MKNVPISRLLVPLLMLFSGSRLTLAQVSLSLGTLPPGGAVTITFDVSINSPFPANTASVTNQGGVTGTGFGPILTDDPNTAATNDPTVTAITVAPQITCPADIVTNGFSPCSLPAIAFGATVTAGVPAPNLAYQLGTNFITSPYIFPAGTNLVMVTATNGTTPNATCSFKVTVLPAVPQLNIVRTGTNVVLSWPTNFPCFTVQVTPSLSPAIWMQVPGPFPSQSGYFYATNLITSTNRFFRLRQ